MSFKTLATRTFASPSSMDTKQIYEKVQERYGSAAKGDGGAYGRRIATAFGYTEDELVNTPKDANLGLSCGNPLALAKLREGETVIDLGSGAGFDAFLAAKKVGANGKVIGVDMNKDMLAKANRNKEMANAANVSFMESLITEIALPNGMADCIISNCVVNLVPEPEKHLAFHEMSRLLKSGGRVAISDILIKKELPEELKKSMALYVGCIAGASQVEDYGKHLHEAGLGDVLIVDKKLDLNIYKSRNEEGAENGCCGNETDKSCCDKSSSCCNNEESAASDERKAFASEFQDVDFNNWAGSFQIYALKP